MVYIPPKISPVVPESPIEEYVTGDSPVIFLEEGTLCMKIIGVSPACSGQFVLEVTTWFCLEKYPPLLYYTQEYMLSREYCHLSREMCFSL